MRIIAMASVLALSAAAQASPAEVEWGVAQRVPGGLASVAEGGAVRLLSVTPLGPDDSLSFGIEGGVSEVVTGRLRPSTSWLAVTAGLRRVFGPPTAPAAFLGAFLDVGFARVTGGDRPGDALFVGGRMGGGASVPAGALTLLLGGWLVANEAGPGLSVTVGCRFPVPF